jgi:hypothetical protein
MNNKSDLAPHEMIELRELIVNCLVGEKKIQATMAMVNDDELKLFMKNCLKTKKENIKSMQTFIEDNINME